MLNFKEKIDTQTKAVNSHSTIKKKNIFKKIAISSILLFSAMATWDVAVTASNISHSKALVDYKYNYYNSLENYNTLKDKINAVPYTDADFKRDLALFSYIYGTDKNSEGFRKFIRAKNGGVNAKIMLYMNIKYNNPDKMVKEIIDYTKNIPIEKIGDWEKHPKINASISNIYEKYYKERGFDTKSKSINTLSMIQSNFKLERSYIGMDDKIYDNFSKLLTSEGFNPYYFFLSKEDVKMQSSAWTENKTKSEKEAIYKKLDDQAIRNNELAIQYYKDGNLEKLKELFKLGHGFTQVVINDTSNQIADTHIAYTVSSVVLAYLGFNHENESIFFDPAKQAGMYAQYTGQMKPGQEEYYDNFFSMLYK